jgi:hypothetical protein
MIYFAIDTLFGHIHPVVHSNHSRLMLFAKPLSINSSQSHVISIFVLDDDAAAVSFVEARHGGKGQGQGEGRDRNGD